MSIQLDPGEVKGILDEARGVVAEPERWVETPHELLGGLAPIDLAERGATGVVRDLLRAIRQGDFT